jgi:hypothetical protein
MRCAIGDLVVMVVHRAKLCLMMCVLACFGRVVQCYTAQGQHNQLIDTGVNTLCVTTTLHTCVNTEE